MPQDEQEASFKFTKLSTYVYSYVLLCECFWTNTYICPTRATPLDFSLTAWTFYHNERGTDTLRYIHLNVFI